MGKREELKVGGKTWTCLRQECCWAFPGESVNKTTCSQRIKLVTGTVQEMGQSN